MPWVGESRGEDLRVTQFISAHTDNAREKKSGYVPAPNSSKCAVPMHLEHLLSLFSALESLDFLEWEDMRNVDTPFSSMSVYIE